MQKIILIPVSGLPEVRSVEATLESLQSLIGGYLQAVNFGGRGLAHADEDGKRKQLPVNLVATALCRDYLVGLRDDDYISGPMFITGFPDSDGNYTDVSEDLIDEVEKNSAAKHPRR